MGKERLRINLKSVIFPVDISRPFSREIFVQTNEKIKKRPISSKAGVLNSRISNRLTRNLDWKIVYRVKY